jgi:hypothetical protein
VVPGNCVRQSLTGATALLGTVSVAASTTLTSSPTQQGGLAWRPMTTIMAPHTEAMMMSWYSNRTLQGLGVPTLRVGSTEASNTRHWLAIASSITSSGGNDYVGAIGSPSADENFGIWGRWWVFEPGTYDYVSLGATAITGMRMQELADVSGTIAAFTDLAGCADGAPVLASGPTGGVRCGTPSSVTAPLVLDFSGDAWDGNPPELVMQDGEGRPVELGVQEAASLLWLELQEQQRTIAAQARELAVLRQRHEKELAALTKQLARLEARIAGTADEPSP